MINSYDACCEMKLANRADIVRDPSMCKFIHRKTNMRLFTHSYTGLGKESKSGNTSKAKRVY